MTRRDALKAGMAVFFTTGVVGANASVYRAADVAPANPSGRWWWRWSPHARKWEECVFESIKTGDLLQYQNGSETVRMVVVASEGYRNDRQHGPSIQGDQVGYAYSPDHPELKSA